MKYKSTRNSSLYYIFKQLDGRECECPWCEDPFISSRNSSGKSVCFLTESSIYTLAVLLVSVRALFHTLAFQNSRPFSPLCGTTIKGTRAPALTASVRPSHFAPIAVFCRFAPVRPACRRLWPWTARRSSSFEKCCPNET